MSTPVGCLRAWWYSYIGGIKEPPSPAMEHGTKMHAEVEQYLRTGVKQLSSQVLAGLHMIPDPGPDLYVEHSLVPVNDRGVEDLSLAPVRVAGIPLLGKIDLLHARGTNKGTSDIEEIYDPPNSVEVLDWKFVSRLDNAKLPFELVNTIQMAAYGKYVFAVAPQTERVRLSHVYFPKTGTPRKSSALVTREQIENSWNGIEMLGGYIREAAKETNPDNVDANTKACRAYGRDCPARAVCKAGMQNSLASFIGTAAADRVIGSIASPTHSLPVLNNDAYASNNSNHSDFNMTTPIAPNSLIAGLQAKRAAQQASIAAAQPQASQFSFATPLQPAPVVVMQPPTPDALTVAAGQPVTYHQVAPIAPDIAAEMARLAAQEQAAQQGPLMQLKVIIDQMDALAQVGGLGFPTTAGQAAQALAAVRRLTNPGFAFQGEGLAGSGELGAHTITDPNVFPSALEEMKKMAAARAPQQPAPVFGQTVSLQPAAPITPATQAPPALLPPDAPASNPMLASKAPEAPPAEGAAPKKRGRKSKADKEAEAAASTSPSAPVTLVPPAPPSSTDEVIADMQQATSVYASLPAPVQLLPIPDAIAEAIQPSPAPVPVPVAAPVGEICFYADCTPDGVTTTSFWPLINHILKQLAQEEGVADVRLSEGRLGFGKWRGGVGAGLRHAFAQGAIPAGHYVLDNASSDVGTTVVDVMRDIVATSGGRFVKGTR